MKVASTALLSCLVLALTACEPAPQSPTAVAGTTAAAGFRPAEQFVGTWSGTTASGGAIQIVVPASGNPSYTFRGSPVRVNSAQMEGDRLVLNIGQSRAGAITLTPAAGGQLQYDYRFGADTATAVLTRS